MSNFLQESEKKSEDNLVKDEININEEELEIINNRENAKGEIHLEMQKIKSDSSNKYKNENEKWKKIMEIDDKSSRKGYKNTFKQKSQLIQTPYQKMISLNEQIKKYKTNQLYRLNHPMSLGYIKNYKTCITQNRNCKKNKRDDFYEKGTKIINTMKINIKKENLSINDKNSEGKYKTVNFWKTKIIPSYLISQFPNKCVLPNLIGTYSKLKENKNSLTKSSVELEPNKRKFDYSLDKVNLTNYNLIEFNIDHLLSANDNNKLIFNTKQLFNKRNKFRNPKHNNNINMKFIIKNRHLNKNNEVIKKEIIVNNFENKKDFE